MADKDKQPQQADFDKAFENMKAGKTMPTENDMGPLPAAKKDQIKKGIMEGLKGYSPSKEVAKFNENYKKGGKVKTATMTFETYTKTGKKAGLKTVPVKKMAKGGTASSRADGCCVKGKTKGKIC